MANAYNVPTQILTNQAKKLIQLYREDNSENKDELKSVGIVEETFERAASLAQELTEIEVVQEEAKQDAIAEKGESTVANDAILDWRNRRILPRAKLAFGNDKRLRHFRPGKLRSRRTATVIREGRLLVAAIRRFAGEAELQRRGLTMAEAERGAALVATAEKEDTEAAAALAAQQDITEQVYDLEDKLDDVLAEIERCAATVFEPNSAALKRYRLNEIRGYIARMHSSGNPVDPSAETEIPDPVPGS